MNVENGGLHDDASNQLDSSVLLLLHAVIITGAGYSRLKHDISEMDDGNQLTYGGP